MSLECPCTTIAVPYKKFVQIQPLYHELCGSDLVSDEYIRELYNLYEANWTSEDSSDLSRTAVFQFKSLRILCQLIQETIEHNIERFLETEFIQSEIISEDLFQIEITSLLANFIDLTPKNFLRTFKFIQDITAQSLFLTGASVTSILPMVQLFSHIGETGPYVGKNYTFANGSSCTCSSSTATTCMGLTTFQNQIVPGFQTGCYMLNAFLQSTLEAFYNQTFINLLTNSNNTYQKLNSSNSNSTIETLLSEMFVTHWSNKTFFERYFNYCSPNLCQYTITQRYDILFILTTLIGLFGGLSSVLRILVPFIIKTIWPFSGNK